MYLAYSIYTMCVFKYQLPLFIMRTSIKKWQVTILKKTLIYLYDPLCGWCYGITPTLSRIENNPDITIVMLPTGLFSGKQPRLIDDEFAAFAWSNDMRIASLTGQVFTERYKELVLGNRKQRVASGPATLALTAVSLTEPTRELEALKAMQQARFIDGEDITDISTLISILKIQELHAAALMMESANIALVKVNEARIARAQAMQQEFSARGVPTFIAASDEKRWKLDTREVYASPEALIKQLNQVDSMLSIEQL
jgi:putative protein-disulfide isomerase